MALPLSTLTGRLYSTLWCISSLDSPVKTWWGRFSVLIPMVCPGWWSKAWPLMSIVWYGKVRVSYITCLLLFRISRGMLRPIAFFFSTVFWSFTTGVSRNKESWCSLLELCNELKVTAVFPDIWFAVSTYDTWCKMLLYYHWWWSFCNHLPDQDDQTQALQMASTARAVHIQGAGGLWVQINVHLHFKESALWIRSTLH